MNEVNKTIAQSNLNASKSKEKSRMGFSRSEKVFEGPSLFLTSEEKTY